MLSIIENARLKGLEARFTKHMLQFKKPSGTSRGILTEKPVWYLIVTDLDGHIGIGECSPIWGLSPESPDTYESHVQRVCDNIDQYPFLLDGLLDDQPSIRFGLEMALLDLLHHGRRILFPSPFTEGADTILINGLIWMADEQSMLQQIDEKLQQGFSCIKLKIGAIDFQQELNLLARIRSKYTPQQIELRVDANGAFKPDEAMHKLEQLAQCQLHSIEQPIPVGHFQQMNELCRNSPIPIALDEELIGVPFGQIEHVLDEIEPQYIILKPSLVGGFDAAQTWITAAEERGIDWWATSALESNIGLNAIAQWTYTWLNPLPQGLGTGKLYTNNIPSALQLTGDQLRYDPAAPWDISQIF